jgi:hypothetical protein
MSPVERAGYVQAEAEGSKGGQEPRGDPELGKDMLDMLGDRDEW